MRTIVLATATLLLAAADWLAFHDLFEHHTVTEYLMLVASLLLFAQVGIDLLRGVPRLGRS